MPVGRIVDAYFNIGHYALDGKEVDGLIGTSHRRLKRKCPVCMETCTNSFILPRNTNIVYRNDNEHELVGKRAWEVQFDKIRVPAITALFGNIVGKRKRTQYTQEQREAELKLINLGINAGHNSAFEMHYYMFANHLGGLFLCNLPDDLHVIDIGLLKRGNESILSIIHFVSVIDPTHFGDNMALLDLNLSYFPVHMSYSPVKKIKFSGGISEHIEEDQTLGLIEGHKHLPLLFQMMFCIGEYSNILPSHNNWIINRASKQYEMIANITEVVLSYCASMIEVIKMNEAEELGYEELDTFQYLLSNATYHWLRLLMLTDVLKEAVQTSKNVWNLGNKK